MDAITSAHESAKALVVCLPDPIERRRILSELIRQRASAIAYQLLSEAEHQANPDPETHN